MIIKHLLRKKTFLLTDTEIAIGVKALPRTKDFYHESADSVRICIEWFLAQKRTEGMVCDIPGLKHYIENWGGRYVSKDDVQVAALFLGVLGLYPKFALDGANLVLPDERRLVNIKEARTQQYDSMDVEDLESFYRYKEVFR